MQCKTHIICALLCTPSTCDDDGGAVARVVDNTVFHRAVVNARISHAGVVDDSSTQFQTRISVNSGAQDHLSGSRLHFIPVD